VVEVNRLAGIENARAAAGAAAVVVDLHREAPISPSAIAALRTELPSDIPLVALGHSDFSSIDRRRKTAFLRVPCNPREVLDSVQSLLAAVERSRQRVDQRRRSTDGQSHSMASDPTSPVWRGEEMRRTWEGLHSD